MAQQNKIKLDFELSDDLKKLVSVGEALVRGLSKPETGAPEPNAEGIIAIREEISRLRSENDGLRARNSILTGEIERVNGDNDELRSQIVDLQAQKGLFGSEHHKDEKIRELEGLLRDLQDQQAADLRRIERLERRGKPMAGDHEPIGPLKREAGQIIEPDSDDRPLGRGF